MVKQLAILKKDAALAIFDGRKKIEGRFSKIKIDPFNKVSRGDVVLMKLPGEDIIGQFIVDRVISYDHPTEFEFSDLKKKYQSELALNSDFWREREKINYITLMFIKSASKFIVPPQIAKRDLRPWVVLG